MKNLIYVLVIMGLAFGFSGCSSKIQYVQIKDDPEFKNKRIIVGGKTDTNSIFRLNDATKAAYIAFQTAAEETVNSGNSYFVIMFPKKLSGIDGSLVDSIQAFKTECIDNDSTVGSMLDVTNMDGWVCNMTSRDPHVAYLEILVYKDEPLETHFDARAVLEELSANNLLVDNTEHRSIDDGSRVDEVRYLHWMNSNMMKED